MTHDTLTPTTSTDPELFISQPPAGEIVPLSQTIERVVTSDEHLLAIDQSLVATEALLNDLQGYQLDLEERMLDSDGRHERYAAMIGRLTTFNGKLDELQPVFSQIAAERTDLMARAVKINHGLVESGVKLSDNIHHTLSLRAVIQVREADLALQNSDKADTAARESDFEPSPGDDDSTRAMKMQRFEDYNSSIESPRMTAINLEIARLEEQLSLRKSQLSTAEEAAKPERRLIENALAELASLQGEAQVLAQREAHATTLRAHILNEIGKAAKQMSRDAGTRARADIDPEDVESFISEQSPTQATETMPELRADDDSEPATDVPESDDDDEEEVLVILGSIATQEHAAYTPGMSGIAVIRTDQ